MYQRWHKIVWAALVLQIPFELKYTWLGLSNLQWTFVILTVFTLPSLYANRQKLIRDRLVQSAALFVLIQWVIASLAPEFTGNALKGAIRFTAGALLLAMARLLPDGKAIQRVWTIASVAAATYALSEQAGFSLPWLFRSSEFFIAQVQRLSGSFEYPNVAAAYFAMSLPLVWWSTFKPAFRWSATIVLWCALLLTFSRGGAMALAAVSLAGVALAWKNSKDWQSHLGLVLAGVAAALISSLLAPYFVDVVTRSAAETAESAQYRTDWKSFREGPGVRDEVPVNIRNTGTIPWRAAGAGRVAVAYRWWNMDTKRGETGSLITELPHDVQPGDAVDVAVPFQTPDNPGRYRLLVELFVRKFDWFSRGGVRPAVVDADIQYGVSKATEPADPPGDRLVQPRPDPNADNLTRLELWRAAIRMFRSHPLGVGPDNYRLMYGRFVGLARWNTNIYSNNLYLELLTGSGVIGLGVFMVIVLSIPYRSATPTVMAIAVFLIHGFLDVFLMTTPIYFSFWILAGVSRDEVISAQLQEGFT
jgi:O-antigen ligase/polysaccharide polymerase Wzy-like membrane protein